ncbi:AIR carboxylase [Rubripirellula lacrimiformis]|uniref:AIR carboxylase n=1 Tax=Rubripirellula lacrimiformis TaxID=1930273 RepID=A0A517N5W8_9BACT|nr:nickel pincer cofactor biosynthesis protein LarB [Rubripirellula lacrimiformis]QDT02522.1 AIR carboxylase [Rubripirellula lacrimiformis]
MPEPSEKPPNSVDLPPALLRLVGEVIAGRSTAHELIQSLTALCPDNHSVPAGESDATSAIDGATVDLGRLARCGFGEVIYGPGKPADLIQRIITTQIAAGQDSLVTRIESSIAEALQSRFEHVRYNPVARTLRVARSAMSVPGAEMGAADTVGIADSRTAPPGTEPTYQPTTVTSRPAPIGPRHVAVITAGSTDAPVAEEAIETIAWMGVPVARYDDIGVAGPQRLLAVVPRLRRASAVVVVAGMEGALPSVVAGHLAVPIFAVPTSVGYGASLGGLTPLLGMLSACAANVAVVNIDAGFKGGYLAGMVVRQIQDADQQTPPSNTTTGEKTSS